MIAPATAPVARVCPAGLWVLLAGVDMPAVTPAAGVLDLREAIVARLLRISELTAIVGDRVRPGWRAADDPLPSVSCFVVSDAAGHHLSGRCGYAIARVQIDCWARTRAQAVAVARSIQRAIDGEIGGWTGFTMHWCGMIDSRDFTDAPPDGSSRPTHRVSSDYTVKYLFV